jgi:alanyl-tRNA synthetase
LILSAIIAAFIVSLLSLPSKHFFMMTAAEIRQHYLDFFKSKGHHIVPSAPIVVKNDPTLMFTNAGMNQFKDYFLGNQIPPYGRVADTQKCLRVSGKHNDLEEVGVDTYHHTMFEMLGNWSFGDYFKHEAISWSWELLTSVYQLPKDRLYATVFEGDAKEGIPASKIALEKWKEFLPDNHIIYGNKKDNFWEMGETGPCGPCTEIHVDLRTDAERALVPGETLVNNDHPQVIEIWNNVFIQYNRKKDGSLEDLPQKHVDTGMGFERLVRAVQNKTSNYDTDVFTGTISVIENIVNKNYDFGDTKEAIAFRVLADHIRAISFTIADGQLPSNTAAGYVIRRILRRAVRYYYSYLDYKQPLLTQLIPVLAKQFENVFPELIAQQDFVAKVIKEEEEAFLKTLEKGLKRMDDVMAAASNKMVSGENAFELHDTYGFPIDLTNLIAQENGFTVDEKGYEAERKKQQERGRADAAMDTEDWVEVNAVDKSTFVGYHQNECTTKIVKYRKVTAKGKAQYQIVLEQTPFYAESGGQVGDTGTLTIDNEQVAIVNTKKENDLIIHFVDNIPNRLNGEVVASIDASNRRKIQRHHTTTHLLQAALQQVLGTHIAQKGSLNNATGLRFDFSHFAKLTDEEIAKVEKIVNQKIRQNIPVVIKEMPKDEAMQLGAMALFGEKYGDTVRVVIIDPKFSIELCGGTHVGNTGEIGIFKITSESAIAAGVRRIEAMAGCKAEAFINTELEKLNQVKDVFKNPKDLIGSLQKLQEENAQLKKQLEGLEARQLVGIRNELLTKDEIINQVTFIGDSIEVSNADALKKICLDLKNNLNDYLVCLTANIGGKPFVAIGISETVAKAKGLDASKIIKEHIAPLIKGGGGGNTTLATAGGQDASNLQQVIEQVKSLL